ncbi:MAG TPA: pantoate--beta-alanine ligase [Methylophilaceae bacterium]|nr:pantoate--beta-alanine ligase [Methylophilaceae bacterium]
MQVISTVAELRQRLANEPSIAFVPTMGNLHAGHISLVGLARQRGQCVVVSIFINPLQFGANEDLANYPRTLEADLAMLQAAGADVVFAPTEAEMYPVPQSITIEPPAIANELCGTFRPGHFRGVATVVLKLFNMVHPQVAVFGKKDFQQLFIIREMVKQLNLPIEIIAGETVHEADGLAMSSRNGYLSVTERAEAPHLYRALQQAVQAIQGGERNFAAVGAQASQSLTQRGWAVDYISVRSASTLAPATLQDHNLVVLGAARQGQIRLIDNIEFSI